jgi:two-component system sensor histidine kinase ChvG
MASDINIKNKNNASEAEPERKTGGLTLRILSVNVVAPIVLMLGFLYISQYRDTLIQSEKETLKIQSNLFAGALAEGATSSSQRNQGLNIELSERIIRRLGQSSDSRIRLFDKNGTFIADSHQMTGPGGVIQVITLPQTDTQNSTFSATLAYLSSIVLNAFPTRQKYRHRLNINLNTFKNFPDANISLTGISTATEAIDESGNVVIVSSSPVEKNDAILGVLILTKDDSGIETRMTKVHFDVFTAFLGALSITIFLSIYLSGIIGRPLKKLAQSAEAVRQSKGRDFDILDLSYRNDEIGELSLALRDMTHALWNRMDTIEKFAADVSHEIKNPLTSLRSAVETASIVKTKKDRDKLMDIIQHDVQRLDRLISDISNASRLDAELSREKMENVDLSKLLTKLVDARKQPLERSGKSTKAIKSGLELQIIGRKSYLVNGNESRLAQVFDNLISNALSFSPKNGTVTITLSQQNNFAIVLVEDEGPGLPENKIENIFDRFYSERPEHEAYGSHSGLGLSIAKQIIEAHNGKIYAENIKDSNGMITGACFTVELSLRKHD